MPAAKLRSTSTCLLADHDLFVCDLAHYVALSTARAVDEGYGVHQECCTTVSATAPKPIHMSVNNSDRVRSPVMPTLTANRLPKEQTMKLRRL